MMRARRDVPGGTRFLLVLGVLVVGTGCMSKPAAIAPCDPSDTARTICPLMNPEDLTILPREGWVLVSEMTHSDRLEVEKTFIPGRLTALRADPDGGAPLRRTLFPREWNESPPSDVRWGDPACAGPPTTNDFQPHGVDVGPGPSGRTAIAVVNHGEREVIDLFELDMAADEPGIEWRGCVAMREGGMANDVALFAGGGFFVTEMMPRVESVGLRAIWNLLKLNVGANTGAVLRWVPGGTLEEVPGSRGSGPNGIAATRDGRSLFMAEWGDERVTRLRFEDGSPRPSRESVAVDGSPDNLSWTPDGNLLVAAQRVSPMGALGCGEISDGGCDVGYSVTRIDPDTLEASLLLEGRGAASAALRVGSEVWIGVFVGDAIERRAAGD